MSDESQPSASTSADKGEDDIPAFLSEGLGLSILSGVAVVPLILPSGNGSSKFLLSRFQLQATDSQIVYEGLIPLDVLTSLSLNLIKACHTAFQNVGPVRNENLMFVEITDLRKALNETMDVLNSLLKILETEQT
jgi:hypothetical protein